MTKTTIELTDEQKQMLRDERLPHESNYGDTIERLCGEDNLPYITEEEARSIARAEAKDMIRQFQ